MMIDKSRAEIAALKELEIHYLSCKFHMAQDWERFMTSSKSGIPVSKSGKKKSPLCHEIRLRLKELQVSSVVQHATSGELAFLMQSVSGAYVQEVAHQSMFTALSNAFKKRLEELKLPAVAKYYEDNWENCAAHWAAWGRTAVKHLRSDTNNLLERFFLRQKDTFNGSKAARRLEHHLASLALDIVPFFIKDREAKVSGAIGTHAETADKRIDFEVQRLCDPCQAAITVIDKDIGLACVQSTRGETAGMAYTVCGSDGSCECPDAAGQVCKHVEAMARVHPTTVECLRNAAKTICCKRSQQGKLHIQLGHSCLQSLYCA